MITFPLKLPPATITGDSLDGHALVELALVPVIAVLPYPITAIALMSVTAFNMPPRNVNLEIVADVDCRVTGLTDEQFCKVTALVAAVILALP